MMRRLAVLRAIFLLSTLSLLFWVAFMNGGAVIRLAIPIHAAQDFPVVAESDIADDIFQDGHVHGGGEQLQQQLPWCTLQTEASATSSRSSRTPAAGKLTAEGKWCPSSCRARQDVAILVPYRDRPNQLSTFLAHMHPFLRQQNFYCYQIFVVEQNANSPFNRAKLFNVGFTEALVLDPTLNCFIFHDVDLLPENAKNVYACSRQPRHMSSSIDNFRYNLPYPTLFGGVVAMTRAQFSAVNGFSNEFRGWGGEDDDLYNRIVAKNLTITRWPMHVARYKMMRHARESPSGASLAVMR